MKQIDQLRAQLEEIGATLDDNGYILFFDAPSGYVWGANGDGTYSVLYLEDDRSFLTKAIREEALPALKMGLKKVTDPKKIERIRYEQDDDSWGAPASAPATIAWPK